MSRPIQRRRLSRFVQLIWVLFHQLSNQTRRNRPSLCNRRKWSPARWRRSRSRRRRNRRTSTRSRCSPLNLASKRSRITPSTKWRRPVTVLWMQRMPSAAETTSLRRWRYKIKPICKSNQRLHRHTGSLQISQKIERVWSISTEWWTWERASRMPTCRWRARCHRGLKSPTTSPTTRTAGQWER